MENSSWDEGSSLSCQKMSLNLETDSPIDQWTDLLTGSKKDLLTGIKTDHLIDTKKDHLTGIKIELLIDIKKDQETKGTTDLRPAEEQETSKASSSRTSPSKWTNNL